MIRELAREESCIIVGRAAGYVLDQEEDLERLIRIFVCADKSVVCFSVGPRTNETLSKVADKLANAIDLYG